MGHLCAGDEGETGGLRQSEQVFEPGAGDLFDDGLGRPAGMDGGVLIPNRCQPVRRKRGR